MELIHAPFYQAYINQLSDLPVLEQLENSLNENLILFESITETKSRYRYAPEKWSIKQLLGHITDVEQIFCYRALCISRREEGSLPGFDENSYVQNSNFENIPFTELVNHYQLIRRATLSIFKQMSDTQLLHKGIANEYEINVNAMLHVIAGHEIHHINILKSHYLHEKTA